MEGRWARLTLQAHLQGALDLTKPVSPLAEALIFNQIEVKLFMDTLSVGPVVSDGKLQYPELSSIKGINKMLLGIDINESSEPTKKQMSDLDLVALYNKLNNNVVDK